MATQEPTPSRTPAIATLAAVGVVYLGVLVGLVWGMQQAKDWAVTTYGGTQAQGDWDRWRDEAAKLASSDGPVQRRIPRSQQPPAYVLLTEYYGLCMVAALLFGSGLYFMLAFALIGTLTPVKIARNRGK